MKIRRKCAFFLVKKEDTIHWGYFSQPFTVEMDELERKLTRLIIIRLWENNKKRKGLRFFLAIMRNN
jgi:hypothetical protein